MKKVIVLFSILVFTSLIFGQSVIIKDSGDNTLMVVADDGNVGIGTTTPDEKLHIAGNMRIDGTFEDKDGEAGTSGQILSSTGTGTDWIASPSDGADNLGNHTATNDLNMASFEVNLNGGYLSGDGDDEGIYVDSDGNVGIGTSIPLSKLSVGGEGSSNATIYGQTEVGRGVWSRATNSGDVTNYGGYFEAAGATGRGVYGSTSGSDGCGVYGKASNSGSVTNYGGYFEALGYWGMGVCGYAVGNYGRGVYGNASNSGSVTNYGGYFQANGSYGRGVYGYASNGEGVENYGGYFEAEGLQGIGVYGKALTSGIAQVNYGGYFEAEGGWGGGVYGKGYGANSRGVIGSGKAYDFDAVGPGVNYGSTSSIRWKKNIVEIDNPLEILAELRGVYFDWDEEHGGGHDVGMIAEEVGKVLPEIVVYEENGIDADGMDYSKLTPLLVEVAKAQQKLIDQLEKRVEELENR